MTTRMMIGQVSASEPSGPSTSLRVACLSVRLSIYLFLVSSTHLLIGFVGTLTKKTRRQISKTHFCIASTGRGMEQKLVNFGSCLFTQSSIGVVIVLVVIKQHIGKSRRKLIGAVCK